MCEKVMTFLTQVIYNVWREAFADICDFVHSQISPQYAIWYAEITIQA